MKYILEYKNFINESSIMDTLNPSLRDSYKIIYWVIIDILRLIILSIKSLIISYKLRKMHKC